MGIKILEYILTPPAIIMGIITIIYISPVIIALLLYNKIEKGE